MEKIHTMKKFQITKPKGINKKSIYFNKILLIISLIIIIFSLLKYFPDISFFKNIRDIFAPSLTICLCVIAKKENLYAKEYVNHYKKLGYKHIYIL